jgi:hypothetical protein
MQRIVLVGIGSAKLTEQGGIEITVSNLSGGNFGRELYDMALRGDLAGLIITPEIYPAEEATGETKTT